MSIKAEKFAVHVHGFSKLLIALRAELDGDLDLVLIMAVIADCHYARIGQQMLAQGQPNNLNVRSRPSSINTLSIAVYTKIPRETIRRKVEILIKKGWVERDRRGRLSPSSQAAGELENGTSATLDYLTALDDQDD